MKWRMANGEWRMVSREHLGGYPFAIPHSPFALLPLLLQLRVEAAEHAVRVALEDAGAVGLAQVQLVDVALGVVEMMPGIGVDAAHGAHHLRREQDVVDG